MYGKVGTLRTGTTMMHGTPVAQAVAVPVHQGNQPGNSPAFYNAGQSVLQQWFNMVDTDRSGNISANELQRALAQGGLNYSLKSIEKNSNQIITTRDMIPSLHVFLA